MRSIQKKHENFVADQAPKRYLKASIQATGIKDTCALSRLPYFDLVKDYILDGMHTLSNVIHLHHGALLGDGYGPHVRNYARANHVNVQLLCGNLPPPKSDQETPQQRVASGDTFSSSRICQLVCGVS